GGRRATVGHRRQRGQHGERVGPPHHVEVEDLAAWRAQPTTLGEEEEAELASLGRLGQVHEGGEVGLAAGLRVAPHGGVVDPREVGGEVDLLGRRHGASAVSYRFCGRAQPKWPRKVDEEYSRRKTPACCSLGTTSTTNRVRSRGRTAGRITKPSTAPASNQSAIRAARSAGVPVKSTAALELAASEPARESRRRRSSRASEVVGARSTSIVASAATASGSRPAASVAPRISPWRAVAAATSASWMKARSARSAATPSAPGVVTSTAMGGWAWGDRGVIDGPRTRKKRPSKST